MKLTSWNIATTLADLPGLAAQCWGGRVAISFKGRDETFTELVGKADRLARGLVEAGVRPGDRVGVWLNNLS